jgi:hypothetical protein
MTKAGRSPAIVRGQEFASKAALERHCREIISGYGGGELVKPAHAMFFLSLILERHDRPDDKILPGLEEQVIGIRVRHGDGYRFYGKSPTNVNHLFVAYENGMEIDFSWKKCCSGFKPEAVATSAMRRAVADQVCEYKRLRFLSAGGSVTSDSSGEPLDWGSSRVDHYPKTFAFLRDSFLAGEGISLATVATRSDERCGNAMADDALRERWASYHDKHKTLRLVSARENETSWREEGAIR